jgi:hypothetical protein
MSWRPKARLGKARQGKATVCIGLGVQTIKNLIKRAKPLR